MTTAVAEKPTKSTEKPILPKKILHTSERRKGTLNLSATIKDFDKRRADADQPELSKKELKALFKQHGMEVTDSNVDGARAKKGGSSKKTEADPLLAELTAAAATLAAQQQELEIAQIVLALGGVDAAKKELEKVSKTPILKLIRMAKSVEGTLELIEAAQITINKRRKPTA